MAKRTDISADYARQLLDYDPESGILTWRARNPSMFITGKHSAEHQCKRWNSEHAGVLAGSLKSDGYLKIGIYGRLYSAHHIAWAHFYGVWPTKNIDHKNGNRALNSVANMREASPAENGQNRSIFGCSQSGLVGVSWFRQSGKWRARIMAEGSAIHLGLFDTKEMAFAAYLDAKAKFHLFQPEPRSC